MANEIAASFPGVVVDAAAERPERATHMLLYLCEESWSEDRLAEQVKEVRESRLPIVMAHENDAERGGCPFSRFFETTPQELIAAGLYRDLAIACFPGLHREVSLSLLAKAIGAVQWTQGTVSIRRTLCSKLLRKNLKWVEAESSLTEASASTVTASSV